MTTPVAQMLEEAHVRPDTDELYFDLGRALLGAAQAAVGAREVFHLALSGGTTPERFYIRLVTDPSLRHLPWERTHVWLVDERLVPEDDPRSNYGMAREALLDHVPMRRRQRHPVPTGERDPAAAYEAELREVICGPGNACLPKLDFVLLGMGSDGHTASLFPHSPVLRATEALVAVNDGDTVTPPPRVTMTFPLLNAARQVAVLVTGGGKAAAVRRVAEQLRKGPDPLNLPITGVDPDEHGDGTLTWYLDAPAASG